MTCVGVPFYFKYKTATILPTSPMHVFALQCRPKIQIVSICSWPQQCELMQKVKRRVDISVKCMFRVFAFTSSSRSHHWSLAWSVTICWISEHVSIGCGIFQLIVIRYWFLIDTFLHVSRYAADYKLSDALLDPIGLPKDKGKPSEHSYGLLPRNCQLKAMYWSNAQLNGAGSWPLQFGDPLCTLTRYDIKLPNFAWLPN